MTNYEKKDVDKRLRQLGAESLYKQGRDFETKYKGVKITGLTITHPDNELPDLSVNKLGRRIANIGHFDEQKVKSFLKGRLRKPKRHVPLETILTSIIAMFSITALYLTMIQQNVLTGFAFVDNLSNTSLNLSIVVCIIGVLTLLFYNMRKRRQVLNELIT
jgi:hypothetical protein